MEPTETPLNNPCNPFEVPEDTPQNIDEEAALLDELNEDEMYTLLSELIEDATKRAREDFYIYTQLMAPVILPEGFKDGRHIELICRELERIEQSVVKGAPERVQIFLPPGSMKSKLLNLFVTWCLGRHPKWNILHIGHSTQFAEDNFGRQIRDVIRSLEYSSVFPGTKVRSDVRASGRWSTTEGGQYYCTGVGTRIAGRRAHLSICDDVISEQTAYSKLEREKINDWYVPGLQSRLLPNGAEAIINTRWHLEDLSGYLINIDRDSKRPWRVISIPAILDKESAELLGLEEGGSFWPELWPLEVLLEKKNSRGMTREVWASLYMQNPIPVEGSLISPDFIKIWDRDDPPPVSYIVVSMDTAFSTSQRADYSAVTVWGVFKTLQVNFRGVEEEVSNIILLDAKKGHWSFNELCEKTVEFNKTYFPDIILIEKKASGQSLIQEMKRRALPIKEYLPDRDKWTRLHATLPFFESSRVWFPKKKWANEVVTELTSFPHVPHDDYVDSTSQAILWLRDRYLVGNNGYSVDEDEEDTRPRVTYWSKLVGEARA